MKILTSTDCKEYLASGVLTEPFLDNDFVLSKVMADYKVKVKENKNYTKIESLYCWINHQMKRATDREIIDKYKFQRTAKEIWDSGFCTGCTDWALLFCVFARQIGIPTSFLATAEYNWTQNLQKDVKQPIHIGHSFCECYYESKWILVDPTFRKIQRDYDVNKLQLDYKVSNSNCYLPYFRGLDFGKKQSMKEEAKEMEKYCLQIEL